MKTEFIRHFKFIVFNKENKIGGVAVSNEKIHARLFDLLNKACHEAIKKFNGELDWYESLVHFEYEGKKYKQILGTKLCEGCIFHSLDKPCSHPKFNLKPMCENKIYILE